MLLPAGQRSTAWVKRLPDVVAALNNEVTSLIGKKTCCRHQREGSSLQTLKVFQTCWLERKKIPPLINVRYLYQPGELEGGTKRATDPIWSLKVFQIERMLPKQISLMSIIYRTGQSGGSSARSCWLCRQPHSCLALFPYASVCTPSSAIQRFVSKGDSETLFTRRSYISWLSRRSMFIPCQNCFFSKSESVVLVPDLFFNHILFTALGFPDNFFRFLN